MYRFNFFLTDLSIKAYVLDAILTFASGPVVVLSRKHVGNSNDYFDKNFSDYVAGFQSKGKLVIIKTAFYCDCVIMYNTVLSFFSTSGESWIGLEKLHQLTSARTYGLRITLKDFDDQTYVAIFDQFQVSNSF